MLFILAAVLAATPPVNLIAVHGPHAEEIVKRLAALPGVTTIDASELHKYLLRTDGIFPMQDFEGFSAGPVKEWAPASADLWTKGVAHCATVVGTPPWKDLGSAMTCANRLSSYLWQQYAAQRQATRVYEIDITVEERRSKASVRGAVWELNTRDQLLFDVGGTTADLDKNLDKVLTALIDKKGKLQARNVVSELESASLGDPFSGQVVATSPVTFPKTCVALPSRLALTPAGTLTDSILARWTPAKATGPEATCRLTFNEHSESSPSGPITVVTTLLACSSTIVSSELAKVVPGTRTPVDIVSERLVQGLATKLCK